MTEEAFKEWKDLTRQEALEKEVKRLRTLSYNQSGKIGSLRRTVYFTYFFFIVLLTVLFLKGMISFPDKRNTTAYQADTTPVQQTTPTKNIVVSDSVSKEDNIFIPDTVPAHIRKTKGTIYCIQIGAYTGIDLDEFNGNMVSLQQDSYEGINQLTLGRFRDHDKAVRFLSIVHQIGFHDAFIMSFKNGRRVPLNTMQATKPAPEKKQEKIIPYTVPEEEPIAYDTLPGESNNF